jgi:hypothetical protein
MLENCEEGYVKAIAKNKKAQQMPKVNTIKNIELQT